MSLEHNALWQNRLFQEILLQRYSQNAENLTHTIYSINIKITPPESILAQIREYTFLSLEDTDTMP